MLLLSNFGTITQVWKTATQAGNSPYYIIIIDSELDQDSVFRFLASYSIVACIKDILKLYERILLTTINRFTINKKKDTASSLALAMTRFSDILLIKLRFC